MVRFARALVFLPLALLAPACSASHDADDGDAAATAELRALSSAEIIGTLSYGETSAPVSYESTPTYRAFRFQGAAGDQVEAWVRSTDGDARGWIVTSAFKNVVSNDNADGSTLDAKLVATLKSTGTYYVVFRDKASEDATFTVSLAKGSTRGLVGAFEREAIRPHIAGPFAQMLRAAVTHAAMLRYLDNDASAGPQSRAVLRRAARRRAEGDDVPRQGGLNENLAREVLELHTLGAASVGTVGSSRQYVAAWSSTSRMSTGSAPRFAAAMKASFTR